MAGLTEAQAQAHLDAALAAELEVLSSQAYSIAGRSQQMALLSDVRASIQFWNQQVKQLNRGGIGIRGVTPT
jgi:hypothetical protein